MRWVILSTTNSLSKPYLNLQFESALPSKCWHRNIKFTQFCILRHKHPEFYLFLAVANKINPSESYFDSFLLRNKHKIPIFGKPTEAAHHKGF